MSNTMWGGRFAGGSRSGLLFELKELYVARGALVKDRTAAKNRGKALRLSLLKRQNARASRTDRSPDSAVEVAILQTIEANVSLADRFAILTRIPGLSNITAFAWLIAMPGTRRSRSRTGRQPRRFGANRPTVRALDRPLFHSRRSRRCRQALYMPALVAARFNPDMKAKYAHTSSKPKTRQKSP